MSFRRACLGSCSPAFVILPLLAVGCNDTTNADSTSSDAEYTSASATLLDFEFDGEVLTSGSDATQAINDQMLFTIGQLNGQTGVGRLDKLELTNVQTSNADGLRRVTYHAKLPVSLAKSTRVGRRYTLVLPKRADTRGQETFYEKYGSSPCVDPNAHDVDAGIFWYYYRPERAGCAVEATDVVRMEASVRPSPENTADKYPEYDRIWDDGILDVIAIFGKVEDGATSYSDLGIYSHGQFVRNVRSAGTNRRITPAETPDMPGIDFPDVTLEGDLDGGRRFRVTSFLVDNVREGGASFEARYKALSAKADVIVYNGHAGLGQNVRALARMGEYERGKYQIIYMNGCDTFAYVDGYLAQSRAALNPDDPKGTKYMEILTNSMPPDWLSLPKNTLSLINDLTQVDKPQKYVDILGHFDQSGFVAVTGEEDNTFTPAR